MPPRPGVGQGTLAQWQSPAGKHASPIGGAAGGQLGNEACLPHAGLAPQQDEGRCKARGPHADRLEAL